MTLKVLTAYHGLLWVQHCEKYKGRWLSDETIVHKINKAYPNIVDGGISWRDLIYVHLQEDKENSKEVSQICIQSATTHAYLDTKQIIVIAFMRKRNGICCTTSLE